ncbi:MAG: SLBB domain-containing protein [Hyphomicrobiaceae bacterium]|nr:SLBB domain-containing protein [Hyphomicrobiaceae bacterium]
MASNKLVASAAADHVVFGDKIKITFFETLPIALRGAGGAEVSGAEASFPRSDMSGEFVVDADGGVLIARIGRVEVAGHSLNSVRCTLAPRFEAVIGRKAAEVSVSYVERPPVYVLGAIKQPGAYAYAPGMILEQILAKAGGLDKEIKDVSQEIERIRQVDRIRELEEQIDRLAMTKARLIALRDEASSISFPKWFGSRMTDAKTKAATEAILANENASFKSERRLHEQQVALTQREVEIAKLELETLEARQEHFSKQIANRRSRADELGKLARRGHLSSSRLDDLTVDLDDLTAREIEHNVTVAQSRRRLVEAQLKLARLVDISKLEYEQQISDLTIKIEDAKSKLGAMSSVVAVLAKDKPVEGPREESVKPTVQILRRGRTGFYDIRVSYTTPILPGDIVRVNSADVGFLARVEVHQYHGE